VTGHAEASHGGTTKPILEIDRLKTHFFTRDGVVRAVDGVSYALYPGETLGVVGESGCGKSITALSVLRLIARPGRIVRGRDPSRRTEPARPLRSRDALDPRQ